MLRLLSHDQILYINNSGTNHFCEAFTSLHMLVLLPSTTTVSEITAQFSFKIFTFFILASSVVDKKSLFTESDESKILPEICCPAYFQQRREPSIAEIIMYKMPHTQLAGFGWAHICCCCCFHISPVRTIRRRTVGPYPPPLRTSSGDM